MLVTILKMTAHLMLPCPFIKPRDAGKRPRGCDRLLPPARRDVHTCNYNTGRWGQEDQELRASLGYTASLGQPGLREITKIKEKGQQGEMSLTFDEEKHNVGRGRKQAGEFSLKACWRLPPAANHKSLTLKDPTPQPSLCRVLKCAQRVREGRTGDISR